MKSEASIHGGGSYGFLVPFCLQTYILLFQLLGFILCTLPLDTGTLLLALKRVLQVLSHACKDGS